MNCLINYNLILVIIVVQIAVDTRIYYKYNILFYMGLSWECMYFFFLIIMGKAIFCLHPGQNITVSYS